MKAQKEKFIILLTSIILVLSMGMVGCEGPMGPEGPQGDQGPPGSVGPAGSDGSIIHAGEGMPDEETGNPGDFYLDLITGNLFGPKTAEGWGAPFNLVGNEGPQGPAGEDGEDGQNGQNGQDGEDGQDGVDGEDGSQIYAGSGAPGNNQGQEGDYYLDKTNFDLYGPKTGSGWGTPINLQGPAGPQGPEGPQGPPGEDGEDGQDGEDGNANVIYSEWIPNNWNYLDDPHIKTMYLEESRVTGDFMNTGVLLVYFKRMSGSGVVQTLPFASYTISIYPIIVDREINGVEHGGIFINAEQNDGTINPLSLPNWVSDIEIRYVLIPGGVPAKMRTGFLEDYPAVKEYYGIPD